MKLVGLSFFIFFVNLFYGCAINLNAPKEGAVVLCHRFYDSLNINVTPSIIASNDTILFIDSMVVYKITISCEKSDLYENLTYEQKTWKYTFLNLRTMIFYDYKSFSDTAPLIRKYDLPPGKYVNWGFYQYRNLTPVTSKLISLTDTIIDGVLFKRVTGMYANPKDSFGIYTKYTYFIDCSKVGSIFHIDKTFDEKNDKCPALRFDFKNPQNDHTISTSYKFVSKNLTNEQKKVFKQWEYNAYNTLMPLEHRLGSEMEDCPSCK